MRQYRIIKSDLGRNIYKKKEEDGKLSIRFLYGHENRGLNKQYAKNFYHREDAVGAMVVMKRKDRVDSDIALSLRKRKDEQNSD